MEADHIVKDKNTNLTLGALQVNCYVSLCENEQPRLTTELSKVHSSQGFVKKKKKKSVGGF